MNLFRENLKQLIDAKFGKKQVNFCKQAKIPVSPVSKVLKGDQDFLSRDHLVKIYTNLGVSINYLLLGQGEKVVSGDGLIPSDAQPLSEKEEQRNLYERIIEGKNKEIELLRKDYPSQEKTT